jgi:hypothetical protein
MGGALEFGCTRIRTGRKCSHESILFIAGLNIYLSKRSNIIWVLEKTLDFAADD